MPLSPAQLATLKTNILANTGVFASGPFAGQTVAQVAVTNPRPSEANIQIAAWYNATAAPAFVLWRKAVTLSDVGDAIVATELAGLTSLNVQRLQVIAQYTVGQFDFTKSDRRAAFDDIFSGAGGAGTRATLLALWKRNATAFEKVFAVGTGTDLSPAVSAFADGATVSSQDVDSALNLP